MPLMQREDIFLISKHSSGVEKGIESALKEHVYSNTLSWQKFLKILFLSLGAGFVVSGIFFFFAYNWEGLNKFFKLGLMEGLLCVSIACITIFKPNLIIKRTLLTAASVLVGVFFMVFGQIYPTGADAFDFFSAWVIFISLWVLISDFAPLWLFYIGLINIAIILYTQMEISGLSATTILTMLFVFNFIVLLISNWGLKTIKKFNVPSWFSYVIALKAISFATIGTIVGIYSEKGVDFLVLILIQLLTFTFGVIYSLKNRNGFYLAIIAFSLIIAISNVFIKISTEAAMLLLTCAFIVASVTFLIKLLIGLQKKWSHE